MKAFYVLFLVIYIGVYFTKKSLSFLGPKSKNAPPQKCPKIGEISLKKGNFFSKFLIFPRNPSKNPAEENHQIEKILVTEKGSKDQKNNLDIRKLMKS